MAGGAAIANRPGAGNRPERPTTLPGERPGAGNRPDRPTTLPGDRPGVANRPERPSERPNWDNWSEGRGDRWEQQVNNRHESWNNWQENSQDRRNNFQDTRDQRWDDLEQAQANRLDWRDQNREDWQEHREDLWDYRGDRAEEIWDGARDFYDDVFDDRWWGACGWGVGWGGNYPSNPWWWWAPAAWGTVSTFVDAVTPDPYYPDYGMTVIYEGDTVYVDSQPVPAAQYVQPAVELAINVEQPPPPLPPAPTAKGAVAEAEWLPLGVFVLAQEEKGDPTMFFQISVSREGVISGGYQSAITGEQRPIAGQADKKTQRVAWRIGDNAETVFETSLANLTQDVSPIAVHFGGGRTQTWLLVRMPEPSAEGGGAPPEIDRKPPPVKPAPKQTSVPGSQAPLAARR